MYITIDKPGGTIKVNIFLEFFLTIGAAVGIFFGAFEFFTYAYQKIPPFSYAAIELIVFITIVLLLCYGTFVYALARCAYLYRSWRYARATHEELDLFLSRKNIPSVTFLIPSYKEDRRTIFQTLFSASLQLYPAKNVVLLIDDPSPTNKEDQQLLDAALDAVAVIDAKFTTAKKMINKFIRSATKQNSQNAVLEAYKLTIDWLRENESELTQKDHTDDLFADVILRKTELELKNYIESLDLSLSKNRKIALNRLGYLFDVRITHFQRKKYYNLSKEPNKAMNINSYIRIMGNNWRVESNNSHSKLVEDKDGDLKVDDADYLITLDADSLLQYDYACRLINVLEKKDNDRIAVIQTPYSAIPNAASKIERLAGAQTDIQYIIHQGFTLFEATYWVGANAVLRKKALEDIRQYQHEDGLRVHKYISDRTVIEDTESTIDLVHKGWKLFNYPRRMSYSATPPDFGSLLIQRRRWANGGLIILPKLLRHMASNLHRPHYFLPMSFMRLHYLISIALVNLGTLLLFFYPFKDALIHWGIFAIAAGYYFLYARDMKQMGYSYTDLPKVYALNLMLVPINIGGVIKSIEQAIFRKKIPFGRTPKIKGRTIAPRIYTLMMFLFPLFYLFALIMDIWLQNWLHLIFTVVNFAAFSYVLHLIGVKESFQELTYQKPTL